MIIWFRTFETFGGSVGLLKNWKWGELSQGVAGSGGRFLGCEKIFFGSELS